MPGDARALWRQVAGGSGGTVECSQATRHQLTCWLVPQPTRAVHRMEAELCKALKQFTSEAGAPSGWQTLGCYIVWCGDKVRCFKQDFVVDPKHQGGWYKFGVVAAKQPDGGLLINTWTVEEGLMQVDRAIQLDASWGSVLAGKVNIYGFGFANLGSEQAAMDLMEIMDTLRGCKYSWDVVDTPAQDLGLISPADIRVGQFRRG